ncbi:MAG: hypothetical protein E6G05_03565 [Actinobacteria bacterium]|nr:MAG: hypothetical protein E6G05_03565 [Actinomycetota bacterium]
MPQPDPASEQADLAAADAARIGGTPSSEDPGAGQSEDAQRPLEEAGQGEAEGFEQAEEELIEHASHADQHAARRAIEDATTERDDARAAQQGDPDYERSSEREEDKP